MPAAAQTVSISATGNCAGTPANCGTSGNRNGDRDTTWPGLQMDEGDTVTVIIRLSGPLSAGTLGLTYGRGGSAYNLSDLRSSFGTNFVALPPTSLTFNFNAGDTETTETLFMLAADGVTESDEDLTFSISNPTPAGGAPAHTISTSSVTIIVRGTDSAPSFGSGSVTNKTYIAGSAIVDFTVPAASGGNGGTFTYAASNLPDGLVFDATGTDSLGCPGTEAREICGTPTTAGAAQTVTITANDADSNMASGDQAA